MGFDSETVSGVDISQAINWRYDMDVAVHQTNTCTCGGMWLSHAKFVEELYDFQGGMVAQKPCPNCGHHHRIAYCESAVALTP